MKPREFRQLHAIPYDIEARKRRIKRLEAMQADGPQPASDVVKSSRGEGNACIMGYATVSGTDIAFSRREDEIRRLKKLNAEKDAAYMEGLHIVETCDDVVLRGMLSDVCIEGKKPQEVAVALTEQGYDIDAEAIRRRVDRWIDQNVR